MNKDVLAPILAGSRPLEYLMMQTPSMFLYDGYGIPRDQDSLAYYVDQVTTKLRDVGRMHVRQDHSMQDNRIFPVLASILVDLDLDSHRTRLGHHQRGNWWPLKETLRTTVLGEGAYSRVYKLPFDSTKVIKIFAKYNSDSVCYDYLRICANDRKFDWMPVVHDLGKVQIITAENRCYTVAYAIMDRLESLLDSYERRGDDLKDEIVAEFEEHIFPLLTHASIDIHWGNIMADSNDKFYLTDPVLTRNGKELPVYIDLDEPQPAVLSDVFSDDNAPAKPNLKVRLPYCVNDYLAQPVINPVAAIKVGD